MKVLYVSSLTRWGPVTHLRDLAPAVAAAGAEVAVVCGHEDAAEAFRARGLEAAVVPMRHKFDLRALVDLWPALAGADVVHTHDRRAGLFARPEARARGAAPVHTFHGLPDVLFVRVGRRDGAFPDVSRMRLAWLREGYMRIERGLGRLGVVVAPSHALARFLGEHGFSRERVRVIPYGISVRRRERGPAHDPPVVGVASILTYRKGVDLLVEACALVGRPLRLEVFGDGPEQAALERRAVELGLDAHFHGFEPDLRARLDSLDVFVLPTRADNLPVAVLEAMAAALPVVGTRVGGVPELVEDGVTGFLAEPESAESLAAALDAVLAQTDAGAALGARGAAKAAAEFDGDDVARRMLALYRDARAR